jgi:hypothetical protein
VRHGAASVLADSGLVLADCSTFPARGMRAPLILSHRGIHQPRPPVSSSPPVFFRDISPLLGMAFWSVCSLR